MQNFIIELFVNCLVCYGARFAFHFGVLSPIKELYEYLTVNSPKLIGVFMAYVSDPLWDCVMCMSSVWGISFLLMVGTENVTGQPFFSAMTAAYIFALCGLNWIISHLIEYLASCNNEITVNE